MPARLYGSLLPVLALAALLPSGGCRFVCEGDPQGYDRPDHWGQASHCPGAAPAHDLLLSETAVARVEISVDPSDHNAAMQDLAVKLSGPDTETSIPNPIWVPATVRHGGDTWTRVGMRYKGNTALKDAWHKGVRKLSFRLQFDRFEDGDPELDDQRFHGFQKMIFASGHGDPSLMREMLANTIFREGGTPAPRTGFARVYLDHGQGLVYMGLYTMLEDPTDTLLSSQLGGEGGNLYKPQDEGARLAAFVKADMVKKSNESAGDYSDVMALIQALNATPAAAAQWRAGLEAVFDVNGFVTMLAHNQAMQNWDAYPFMPHNYFLYADPGRGGRLRWIPTDLTESLMPKVMEDGTDTGSVLLTEVTSGWPLVRRVLDDPVYMARYRAALQAALQGAFARAKVEARLDAYFQLISPYVVGEQGERAPYTSLDSPAEFTGSLTVGSAALKPHVAARHAAVARALGQ